jgi:hypothetical protein
MAVAGTATSLVGAVGGDGTDASKHHHVQGESRCCETNRKAECVFGLREEPQERLCVYEAAWSIPYCPMPLSLFSKMRMCGHAWSRCQP